MVAYLGCSLAGHDKGKVYYIVKEDEKYVWLCNGEDRTIDFPKKKNKKHIQIIKESKVVDLPLEEDITNETVKRAVKLYCKGI